MERFDLEAQLRQHGHSLRHLAQELLRRSCDVDDALQETWLHALRRPPRHDGQLGNWLALVLRHTIGRARRSERRRQQRERNAARGGVGPDHADTFVRSETARQLLAAVQQLDPPFRDAIWQRYFEELPPREIAARAGVPLATVKSRLQRGLQQLRERLGEGGESDWRGALVAAFGFDVPEGTGITAAAVTGGVTMAAWMKSAATAVVAGVAVWLCWPTASGSVSHTGDAESAEVAAAHGAIDGEPAAPLPSDTPPLERREAAPAAAAATTPATATLVGRCVDTTGNAIAGCTVRLQAWQRNLLAMDEWLRDHPEPEWRNLKETTGADGRFEFHFVPFPPLQFAVHVHCKQHVALMTRWSSLAAGSHTDVGDVVLQPGVLLTGLLTTEAGTPLPNADLTMEPVEGSTSEDGRFEHRMPSARTDTDGRFQLRVPPGRYHVDLRVTNSSCRLTPLTLPADPPIVDVKLVAPAIRENPRIRGRVVDADGRPVSGAQVRTNHGASWISATTHADGTFELSHYGNPGSSTELVAVRSGFETATTRDPVAWGTKDVVIVMQAAAPLTIRVTETEGAPVGDYSVRLLPHGRDSGTTDYAVWARGPFTDGVAVVSVARGSWTVMLEFPSESEFSASFHPIEMTSGPRRLDVVAERPATRIVRVVDGAGAPVQGTRVQLFDLVDGPLSERTMIRTREQLFRCSGPRALVTSEQRTDAEGRCSIAGPSSRDLGLALLGPGHIPLRRADVRVDVDDELVVTVQRGARLRGRIAPPAILDHLRRMQGLAATEPFPEGGPCPALTLHRTVGGRNEWLVFDGIDQQFPVDGDGTFDFTGLPPGQWQCQVIAWRRDGQFTNMVRVPAPQVALRDGETTSITIDLSRLLPGTLEAVVQHNGVPVADTDVHLQCTSIDDANSAPVRESPSVRTDSEGRFTFVGWPGEYTVRLVLGIETFHRRLDATSSAIVTRDQTTHHTFAIWSGSVQFVVRDSEGRPVQGLETFAMFGSGAERIPVPVTNAEGVVETVLPAGTARLCLLPKRLQSFEAQERLRQQAGAGGADPVRQQILTLATIEVTAERDVDLELTLPPEWDR